MFILPQYLHDTIIAHAKTESPNECCGLLAGRGGIATVCYPIENLPSDAGELVDLELPPERHLRYVMDPQGQLLAFKEMRLEGTELLAIYHSHPHTPAYPSGTDVRLAFSDVHYLIVSLASHIPTVRAFLIRDGKVSEETIVEGGRRHRIISVKIDIA
jgi:proteasome lid subunit RPN8/RPN11